MALMPLYWDQAELDRQFSARATVPDVFPFLAEYRARTEAVQSRAACRRGVAFGPTEPERLDIYPVPAQAKAPVFVYIHGGYWRALDASDSGFMAGALADAGICTVALNYALAPAVSLDEIVRQCRAALGWLYHHVAEHGGDPARIHLGGSSAGAHLAAMLAAPEWVEAAGLPPDVVKSLTLLSGLFDLTMVPRTHLNAWLHLDAAAAERNSPLWRLPRAGLPVLASYGPNETDEFKRQTETYLAACYAAGCRTRAVPVPATNHFTIPFALAEPASALFAALRAQIGA